jgi:hypothetical protein
VDPLTLTIVLYLFKSLHQYHISKLSSIPFMLLSISLFVVYTVNLPMVRPCSCRVIYYFDTPTLERRHQLFDRVKGVCKLSNKEFPKWFSLSPPLYLYCSTWTVERNTKILQIYKSTLNESMCKFLYFLSYHRPYCNTFPNSDCFEIFTQDKTVSLQILHTISPDPTVGLGDMIDTVKLDSWCLLRQNLNFML